MGNVKLSHVGNLSSWTPNPGKITDIRWRRTEQLITTRSLLHFIFSFFFLIFMFALCIYFVSFLNYYVY